MKIKKWLATLTCACMLTVGSCLPDSWSVAVNPGFGDANAFVGVELDFGDLDVVVPLFPMGL